MQQIDTMNEYKSLFENEMLLAETDEKKKQYQNALNSIDRQIDDFKEIKKMGGVHRDIKVELYRDNFQNYKNIIYQRRNWLLQIFHII